MQRSTSVLILLAVLVAVVWLSSQRQREEAVSVVPIPARASLNHFKCYTTTGLEVGAEVWLQDQFAAGKVRVLDPAWFCNPVEKKRGRTVSPVVDRDAHLKFYRIAPLAPPNHPPQVTIQNQFGKAQGLTVLGPKYLAVPTRKLKPGRHGAPKGLSHYQCYAVAGDASETRLELKDEFLHDSVATVGVPSLLCNPVEKRFENRISPILGPKDPLVCYELTATAIERNVTTLNQFGRENGLVEPPYRLCVPSKRVRRKLTSLPGGVEAADARLAKRALFDKGEMQALPPEWKGCASRTGDFVVTGSESSVSGDEHCFPSLGSGLFGARTDIPGIDTVDGMDVADLDGDGDNDFLACDGATGRVYQYLHGPGSVFTPSVVASGITAGVDGSLFCTNLRVADFDKDGDVDFVVGDNRVTKGVYIFVQGPVGSFAPVAPGLDVSWASPTGKPCNCLFGLAADDVDGDGNADVAVLGYGGAAAGQVHLYRGDGAGGMMPPVLLMDVGADFPVMTAPTGIALFDQDLDGDLDVIVGGSADGSHYLYRNDGGGVFTAPAGPAFSVDNFSGIDAYTFDTDDDEDLVLTDWSTRRLLYVKNEQEIGGTLAAPVPVGALAGPSIAVGAPEAAPTVVAGLDHFACYVASRNRPVGKQVFLKDQFGASSALVGDVARFCTPVAKVHEKTSTDIRNRDAHLALYRLKVTQESAPRALIVSNQLGKHQRIQVGDAGLLAVPTQKRYPGEHRPPVGLDHFQCYRAAGEPLQVTLSLKDQFLSQDRVTVFEPFALCNPAAKRVGEEVTEIRNPDDHLMCYRIKGTGFEGKVRIRNQFGETGFAVRGPDVLCVPSTKSAPIMEPNITQMCGDRDSVDFNGGMVAPGGAGTGLLVEDPDASWPAGRPRRPCGEYVPIDGFLPGTGVTRFRVAYRRATDPPPAALGTAPGLHTKWVLRDRTTSTFCKANPSHVLETTGPQAWMDANAYLEAQAGGPSTDWCPNGGLKLAVWDSANNAGLGPPDTNGHYVLWLEWEDTGGVLHSEPFEHHLQLDNEPPVLSDFKVTLADGTTPLGACGDAPAGSSLFKVYADFHDAHYWGYKTRVRGGKPPKTVYDDWHNYYDGTASVANTDETGTTSTTTPPQFLRDIDMTAFGTSFVDCCYVLDLFVRDATIRHRFNNREVDETTSGYWDDVSDFITFSAAPAP